MIEKVTLTNFKCFKNSNEFQFKPDGITFLAGGNNSGKSSLLQSLAVWEFARSVLEITRGPRSLLNGWNGQGIGVPAEEFSPIALPNLKHLWSDLHVGSGGGYSLRIRCDWQSINNGTSIYSLEFGLSLANDRLFIKPTQSNLAEGVKIPRFAYLPPFAGIGSREERMYTTARKRWIGRGLAGAVLRNLLYDLWEQNDRLRSEVKGARKKIPSKLLAQIRREDGWEQLLQTLEEIFKTGLTIKEFNEFYHNNIDVGAWEGRLVNKQFRKQPGAPVKDLMVEGSGFLQWLSVYTLALNKELDILLLDEPDAHLHPSLQGHLIHKLSQLARENKKQVMLATHSTTILSETKLNNIYRVEDRTYLSDEGERVKLFLGLGSIYAPRIDQLKRCKRLFLHEGPSDLEILQAWVETLGKKWPDNLVCWEYTQDRTKTAREILFDQLRAEISDLRGISLQDRDDYQFNQTKKDLTFDNLPLFKKELGLRRWRRRNIENYLLHPDAIARAANVTVEEVRRFLQDKHALAIPDNFTDSDCPQTLAHTDGKVIITKHDESITTKYGVTYLDIAREMRPEEIPDDPKTLIDQLIDLSK